MSKNNEGLKLIPFPAKIYPGRGNYVSVTPKFSALQNSKSCFFVQTKKEPKKNRLDRLVYRKPSQKGITERSC
nr:CBM_HP1_G0018160.mRNA.1.CDS.1 [Saccharomyces cerevisiae]